MVWTLTKKAGGSCVQTNYGDGSAGTENKGKTEKEMERLCEGGSETEGSR